MLAFSILAAAPAVSQVDCAEALTCNSTAGLERFGESVALSDGIAAIGSQLTNTVCLFEFDGTAWNEIQTITPPAPTGPGDGFGYSVAMTPSMLIIAAPFEGYTSTSNGFGAAYVYERDPSTGAWSLLQRLAATGVTSSNDVFGIDVDIDGPFAVVSAVGDDTAGLGTSTVDTGAVYLYRFVQGQWFQEDKVFPSVVQGAMRFGLGVSVSEGRAFVGTPFEDYGGFTSSGTTYIFERQPNTTWLQVARLECPDPGTQTFFGVGVDNGPNLGVIGAEGVDNGAGGNSGKGYVYIRDASGAWSLDGDITPSTPAANETFANQVSIDGTRLIASARGDSTVGTAAGAVHVFERLVPGVWSESQVLVSPQGGAFDTIGTGIDLKGGVAIVGSPGDDSIATNGGAGLLFDVGIADCNSNGQPDSCDIAGGTAFDCNGNGVPDSCDIADGTAQDCNGNGIPDACDIQSGTAMDCNGNGVPDLCDIASGAEQDCNLNSVPDSCDIASGTADDCNGDGVPDQCQITSLDCNMNGLIDSCEVAAGTVPDINGNMLPDECEAIGTVYCAPNAPNSAFQGGAEIDAIGTAEASATDVVLRATSLPQNSFGFFLDARLSGFTPFPPNSSGILCLAGSIGRLDQQIVNSGTSGSFFIPLDLQALPTPTGFVAVLPGDTWYFQAWYRDSFGSMLTSNFTTAIEITFQ